MRTLLKLGKIFAVKMGTHSVMPGYGTSPMRDGHSVSEGWALDFLTGSKNYAMHYPTCVGSN